MQTLQTHCKNSRWSLRMTYHLLWWSMQMEEKSSLKLCLVESLLLSQHINYSCIMHWLASCIRLNSRNSFCSISKKPLSPPDLTLAKNLMLTKTTTTHQIISTPLIQPLIFARFYWTKTQRSWAVWKWSGKWSKRNMLTCRNIKH